VDESLLREIYGTAGDRDLISGGRQVQKGGSNVIINAPSQVFQLSAVLAQRSFGLQNISVHLAALKNGNAQCARDVECSIGIGGVDSDVAIVSFQTEYREILGRRREAQEFGRAHLRQGCLVILPRCVCSPKTLLQSQHRQRFIRNLVGESELLAQGQPYHPCQCQLLLGKIIPGNDKLLLSSLRSTCARSVSMAGLTPAFCWSLALLKSA
jgi:hypothetical protein